MTTRDVKKKPSFWVKGALVCGLLMFVNAIRILFAPEIDWDCVVDKSLLGISWILIWAISTGRCEL